MAPPPDEKKPAPPPQQMTRFAAQASLLADVLAERHEQKRYGAPAHKLRVEEPSGPSTAGGKRARQPITLVPVDGGPSLTCGWLDVSKKESFLRSYESLTGKYGGRFEGQFPISARHYERFLEDLTEDIQRVGYKLLIATPDGDEPERSSPGVPAAKLEKPKAVTAPAVEVSLPPAQSAARAGSAIALPIVVALVAVGFVLGTAFGYLLAR